MSGVERKRKMTHAERLAAFKEGGPPYDGDDGARRRTWYARDKLKSLHKHAKDLAEWPGYVRWVRINQPRRERTIEYLEQTLEYVQELLEATRKVHGESEEPRRACTTTGARSGQP